MLLNYELLKNNKLPVIITKDDRVKYFEYLNNQDILGLTDFLRDLSTIEKERMEKFGYKN